MPEFSIVMPVFNREHFVARALKSCLNDQQADFEIVVVDDGSTDGSTAVVESLRIPRLKLIRHETNRGLAAACNAGVDAATGEWVVLLDSDDELLPGALARMSGMARGPGGEFERMAFMYRRDDGGVSPYPPLRDENLDYIGCLRRLDGLFFYDFLQCTRRFTFDSVRWRGWKTAGYMLYSMDFPLRYRTLFSSEILGLVHSDAPNRLSWQLRKSRNACQAGKELGEEMDLILSRHGQALARFAPRTLQRFLRVRASYHFMTGAVGRGVAQTLRCLRVSPLSAATWLQLLSGLAGPRFFTWLRSRRPPPT